MDDQGTFTDINLESSHCWRSVPKDWRRPGEERHYRVLWDAVRSYGQIWPRPGIDEVNTFYEVDEYYTHSKEKVERGETLGILQKLQTKISWWLDRGTEPNAEWWGKNFGYKPLNIVEVGCGNGSNLSLLKSIGYSAVGIDPDCTAIDVCKKLDHTVINCHAEDMASHLEPNSFDIVYFSHVLEHCINPDLAIKEAKKIVKSDGFIIAEVPNNECLGSDHFCETWLWLDIPRHLNFFSERSLMCLLEKNGLMIKKIEFRGYCRQFGLDWKNSQHEISNVFGIFPTKLENEWRYWKYLFRTATKPQHKKYDSIRIIGTNV